MSCRRIKRGFHLDDDALEDVRRELISTLRIAADVDGELLVWAPDGRAARSEPVSLPCQSAWKQDPGSASNRDPYRRLRSGRPRSPWRGPARVAQCPDERRSEARGEALWIPGGDPRAPRPSGSIFEAPALVAGFENVAMMGQPVEQCGCHFAVAEDAGPLGEREIGRHDDRGPFVEPAD
jgi:hypothetical protein